MPAMDVNDNAHCLDARVVWAFIASMLAPTGYLTGCFALPMIHKERLALANPV